MKGLIYAFLIMFVGFYMTVWTCYYYVQDYRYKAIVLTMTESAKVSSVNSYDKSVRVSRGKAEITEKSFKEKFEKTFKENSNVNLKPKEINYSFLKDGNGGIKAVKVKLIDDRNKEYKVTLVSNIAE